MSELSHTSLWTIFSTIIISGGIVAGLFEWFRNYIAKRREEYVDISKLKIDYISKSLPFYSQMVFYHNGISDFLATKKYKDYVNVFLYYLSNLLYLKDGYFKKFGAIQLGSFRGESVLEEIGTNFNRQIADKIGFYHMSLISNLAKDKIGYHQFEEALKSNKDLIDLFLASDSGFFSDLNLIKQLKMECRCFAEIMTLEVNTVYREWYGKEEELIWKSIPLKDDVVDYIKENHYDYYPRLISLTGWSIKTRILHPLLRKKITTFYKLRYDSIPT